MSFVRPTEKATILATLNMPADEYFGKEDYFAARRSFMASQICRFFASGATLQSMISSIVR
jgi:hypothetical protein